MRKFVHREWSNYLRISVVPLLSLLAFLVAITSYAGRIESAGGFIPSEVSLPAPTDFNELDYYRWTFRASQIPAPADLAPDSLSNGERQQWLRDFSYSSEAPAMQAQIAAGFERLIAQKEEDAHADAETSPEDLTDPAKKAKFEEALKQKYRADLNDRAPGPYQKYIWAWYQQEKDFEQGRAALLESLGTEEGKNRWLAEFVANKRFDGQNATEINAVNTGKTACMSSWLSLMNSFSSTRSTCQPIIDREQRLIARRAEYVRVEGERLAQDAAIRSSAEWQEGQSVLADRVKDLEASPFFRPEVWRRLQASSDKILIDVDAAKWQNMEVEINPAISVPKRATVGFDGYAIIDAPIDAVLGIYQFRNGVPARMRELNMDSARVYPLDGLFNYRREESYVFDAAWGPGAYFNRSYKMRANRSFVRDLMDSYANIVRGDATRGYDVIFQLLGKGCPAASELPANKCATETKANFTIVMLRPLPDGKTAYKISGRFIGQSYGLPITDGVNTIGFDVSKFRSGQVEFGEQSKAFASAQARIQAARTGGQSVVEVNSANRYYFRQGNLVQLNPSETPNPNLDFLITREQNFFQLDGRDLVQLIEDRGSRELGGERLPIQAVPFSRLR